MPKGELKAPVVNRQKKCELQAVLNIVEARMRGAEEPRDFLIIAKQLREAARKAARLSAD